MGDSLSRLDNLLAIFIHNSIYFFFYWLINFFAQSLAPTYLLYLKNYLVLLSSISFLAILSKHYLLLYQYIIVNRIKFNFINLLIKLVVVVVVVVLYIGILESMPLSPATRLPILTFVKVFKSSSAFSRCHFSYSIQSFIKMGNSFPSVSRKKENIANYEWKMIIIAVFLLLPRKGLRAANLKQDVT